MGPTAHRLAAHASGSTDEATTAVIVVRWMPGSALIDCLGRCWRDSFYLMYVWPTLPHAQIIVSIAAILAVYFGVLRLFYGSYSLNTVVREYKERRRLEDVSRCESTIK